MADGKVVPGSGAGWVRKGDVLTDRYLIEAKTTGKKSFTIQSEVLRKITLEAIQADRIPMLVFELEGRSYAVQRLEDVLDQDD